MIKNIRKVVVTDADGKEYTFEGTEGWANVRETNAIRDKSMKPLPPCPTLDLTLHNIKDK